jgi:hypothetical protein
VRPAPAGYAEVLGASHGVTCRVSAWRGGVLLAAEVPVTGGQLTEAADQAVPERLTLTVPATDPATGVRWLPDAPATSPLGQWGQRLRVVAGVVRADGTELAVPLGWFRVESWDAPGDAVEVEATGLLGVLDQARLLAPTSPPSGATFAGELRRLVDGLVPVTVDPALVNRAVPSGFAWTDDRLGAVLDLLAAWPARAHVDPSGVLTVRPAAADSTDPPEVLLSHGDPDTGTVVEAATGGDRAGVANVVVARGAEDGTVAPVTGYAYDTDPASAARWGGPYGPAPLFYASPLLTTTGQAAAAAATRLATSRRRVQQLRVTTVPDARVSAAAGTRVDVTDADGRVHRCRALGTTLPLTADAGPAVYTLGVLP